MTQNKPIRISYFIHMKNIDFWKKTSNYSTILLVLMLILFFFFDKYIQQKHLDTISYIGIILLFLFVLSELMKFILKRKK